MKEISIVLFCKPTALLLEIKKKGFEMDNAVQYVYSRLSVCLEAKHPDLYLNIIVVLLDIALWLTRLKLKHNNYY